MKAGRLNAGGLAIFASFTCTSTNKSLFSSKPATVMLKSGCWMLTTSRFFWRSPNFAPTLSILMGASLILKSAGTYFLSGLPRRRSYATEISRTAGSRASG